MNPSFEARRRLVCLMFFLSGACGLIYEIVWTRMMSLVFGVTVYAITSVLCSFMLGLALGSIYFGRNADRVRRPLALYGWLEIGIGALALLFPPAMEAVKPLFVYIHRNFHDNYLLFSIIRFGIILPIMLLPTFLMGGTLPLITRYFAREGRRLASDLGLLYATNTIGAMAGTFAVGFLMLDFLGVQKSIYIAAAANLAVGVAAIILGGRHEEVSQAGVADAQPARDARRAVAGDFSEGNIVRPALVYWAIGLSGFASLGLQIIWNRVLVFHTNNSTYAFTSILMVFLFGLSIGSYIFSFLTRWMRHPLRFFALLELGIGAFSLLTFFINSKLLRLNEIMNQVIPFSNWFKAVIMMNIQVMAMFLVPTLLMGMTLPLATRLVTARLDETSRKVGAVYAANTIGAVLGSFLVGFVMIPFIGVRTSLILLVSLNLLIAGLLFWNAPPLSLAARRLATLACLALIPASIALIPADVLHRFYSRAVGDVLFFREEVTDTIMVVDAKDGTGRPNPYWRWLVFSDMRGTAGHPTKQDNRFTAHLPMLLHPNPENVITICVGASNSSGAFALHERLKSLDCVELSKGVVEASQYFNTNYGVFKEPRDPRVHVHIEDGRNFLLATENRYDVIHLEPPLLYTNGVVFLYTRDFYELCRQRLRPGGLVVQWVNVGTSSSSDVRTTAAAFQAVFPNGVMWHTPDMTNVLFIGGEDPLRVKIADIFRLLQNEPRLAQCLMEDNLDYVPALFSLMLKNPESMAQFCANTPMMTDDRTIIDFANPRNIYSGYGFTQIVSNNSWDKFFKWTPELWKRYLDGSWAFISRLSRSADSPNSIIDWSGLDEGARGELDRRIAELQALRASAMEGFSQGNLMHRSLVNLSSAVNPTDRKGMIYALNPGREGQLEGAPVKLNKEGLRANDEIAIERPANEVRVAAVGDEVTFGMGVPLEASFPALLEGALGSLLPDGQQARVINFATPGYGGVQKVNEALGRALDYKPDVLLMQWHPMDHALAPFVVNSNFISVRRAIPNIEPVDFPTIAMMESKALRRRFAPIDSLTPWFGGFGPGEQYKAYYGQENLAAAYRRLAAACAERNVRLISLIPPSVNVGESSETLATIRAVGTELNIPLIEVDSFVGASGLHPTALQRSSPDDPTPTAEAHRLIAGATLRAVAGAVLNGRVAESDWALRLPAALESLGTAAADDATSTMTLGTASAPPADGGLGM